MNCRKIKKIVTGRHIDNVLDIMKQNGWNLVASTNDHHMVFSNGFSTIDIYIKDQIAYQVI